MFFSLNWSFLPSSLAYCLFFPWDLCAAILLACLFCHPLDCLLATMRGCNQCVWSLCSFLCGCEPATLQPLLDVTHHCDLCGCLGVRCFLCDCPVCDICLQATECLDLAMEISQMLYHWCQQITTSRTWANGNHLFVKIFQKPTCRDKTQMLPVYG